MQPVSSVLVIALLTCGMAAVCGDTSRDIDAQPSHRDIDQLIEQLGSQTYGQRKYAQAELRHLGYQAIDQLIDAQYDESSEISLAARQILGRISVLWTQPGDAEISQQILRDYDRRPLDERVARARWLAQLEDGIGFLPLARIIRYEPSELVSKHAAIAVMKALDEHDPMQVRALHQAISDIFGASQRRPIQWLRVYARDLTEQNPENVRLWQQLAQQEKALASPRSSNGLAAAIFRQAAIQAFRHGDNMAGRDSVQQLVELQSDDLDALVEASTWLLDAGQQSVFQQLIWPRFDHAKTESPQFLYCGAESFSQSDEAQSVELASRAFDLTENVAIADPEATSIVRFNSALYLEQRGLTEWSIREYRRLMASEWKHWRIDYIKEQATIRLSELLHDRGRDEEAADVLSALINKDTRTLFENAQIDADSSGLVSRMEYFRAEHHRRLANREKQIEHLRKAVQADPTDADVLIAMYRLPRAEKAWVEETKRNISKAVSVFERRLQRLRASGEIENRREVATHLNQIAWLVGNTEGDQQKAVQQSRRSLELRPRNAGSLDTLGRCYFAVGYLDEALKYQRRAARLEPHSQQIARQLEEFEAAAVRSSRP